MHNPYAEHQEEGMRPITMNNLFGVAVPMNKKGKPLSERQALVKYFVDRAVDLKGKLAPSRMGYMLSHLGVQDLYYMKSVLESEPQRPWPEDAGPRPSTHERWNRIFWGMLKSK